MSLSLAGVCIPQYRFLIADGAILVAKRENAASEVGAKPRYPEAWHQEPAASAGQPSAGRARSRTRVSTSFTPPNP